MSNNAETTKQFYKVKRVESGRYEYDTVFVDIDGAEVQVPILKDGYKPEAITGKNIKVLLGYVIEKVEIQ